MWTISLFALAVSGVPTADAPLIPAFFTGDRLYEICTGPNQGQCWMYVAGVLDGMFEAESNVAEHTICRTSLTNRDAAEDVMKYLRDNEEFRDKAAAVAVKAALKGVLACTPDEATSVAAAGGSAEAAGRGGAK